MKTSEQLQQRLRDLGAKRKALMAGKERILLKLGYYDNLLVDNRQRTQVVAKSLLEALKDESVGDTNATRSDQAS